MKSYYMTSEDEMHEDRDEAQKVVAREVGDGLAIPSKKYGTQSKLDFTSRSHLKRPEPSEAFRTTSYALCVCFWNLCEYFNRV